MTGLVMLLHVTSSSDKIMSRQVRSA